jgi:Trk K+ transport system NAD-binding subunit
MHSSATLQIAIMLTIIIPLLAITQPFVTATPGLLTLAIVRTGEQVLIPRGRDMLRAGDVLAVAGSADAVAAARELIEGGVIPANAADAK